MLTRLKVCILQVPPFHPSRRLGGAEVIAVELARSLASIAKVTVLHGSEPGPARATMRHFPGFPAQVLAAFPLDSHVRQRGHIRPQLTGAASEVIAAADILVSIERTLDYPCPAGRIAMLGGVGYPHTLDVLASGAWDRLVVPSAFVARQVTRYAAHAPGVVVLLNGIDVSQFRPTGTAPVQRPRVRLLLSCRPTWDKGFHRAFTLAGQMERAGMPTQVVCFAQPDGLERGDFAEALRAEATGIRLEILPWRSHPQMAATYQAADLTLCLGDAEEGFGLAAAESVATGTPVLATPAGFLAEMLPPEHGIFLVAHEATGPELLDAAKHAMAVGRQHCHLSGRPYVAARYGIQRMRDEMARIVQELSL